MPLEAPVITASRLAKVIQLPPPILSRLVFVIAALPSTSVTRICGFLTFSDRRRTYKPNLPDPRGILMVMPPLARSCSGGTIAHIAIRHWLEAYRYDAVRRELTHKNDLRSLGGPHHGRFARPGTAGRAAATQGVPRPDPLPDPGGGGRRPRPV